MAQQIYKAEKKAENSRFQRGNSKGKILENNLTKDNRLWKYGTGYDLKYFFIFLKIILNINILKYKNNFNFFIKFYLSCNLKVYLQRIIFACYGAKYMNLHVSYLI